ncbi:unnamed protein product, partial [Mesorhabditis belari]|uniref:Uncharacterized protein n=1 Tax=Mesorhabditis belari TaxID=2138241 RepID=A0AAF3F3W1_9BILA
MQAGPSSSNGTLHQNGHQEYRNRKVASKSKSPSELDLEILQERDQLRVELKELREIHKKSSDELFDMKIGMTEWMVLLSPYREIYEGHGVYRQWMPYEINKSQEVLGLDRPVEEEIAAENKRFAESQERGRIRRIASRIIREPEAWKLFDFVEKKSLQNGFHEENAEMLEVVKEQEAQEEAQPQKAGVDQDRSTSIQEEEKKPEKLLESDQLPLVEPIEPATSVESLQGSVDEQKPATSMNLFEAYSQVFLASTEHTKRMIEARRSLSQLPKSDYQLPENCNEDGPLVVRFVAELNVTVVMRKFKKPIRTSRQPKPRKYATRSSPRKQTVQVKVEEEAAKSSTNEEPERPIENVEALKSKNPRGTKRAATNRRSSSNGPSTSPKRPKEEPCETPKKIIADAKEMSNMGKRTSARRKSTANKTLEFSC